MRSLFVLGAFVVTLGLTQTSWAGWTQFNRISSTLSGSSGLFFSQSIDTLSPGRVETSLGLWQEEGSESTPASDFSRTAFSTSITVGLSSMIEVSGHLPYFIDIDQGSAKESGAGDLSLSMKWRFLDPSAELNFPGFALSLSIILPTGEPSVGAGSVESWGLKILLLSSAETEVGLPDSTILVGFYANGGIYIQDSGDPTNQEKHGIFDLGLLFPLNETREIQLIIEGNGRLKRESDFGNDYTAVTAGFRLVTRHVALNAGWQHRFNKDPFDASDRFIFYGSYFF